MTVQAVLLRCRGRAGLAVCLAFSWLDLIAPYGLLAVSGRIGWGLPAIAVLLTDLSVTGCLAVLLNRDDRGWIAVRVVHATLVAAAITTMVALAEPGLPAGGAMGRAAFLLGELPIRLGPGMACAVTAGMVSATVTSAIIAASLTGRGSAAAIMSVQGVDTLIGATLGLTLGLMMRWAQRRQAARALREAVQRRQAEVTAAELAVRSQLQIGPSGTIIDRLQSAVWRLQASGVDAAFLPRALGRHKAAIAARVRSTGAYLSDVLQEQATAARRRDPSTSAHHFFDVDRADGLTVLTEKQAATLRDHLDARSLQGRVPVRLLARERDSGLVLSVAAEVIDIPAGQSAPILHLGSAGLLLAGIHQLANMHPGYAHSPWYVVVPLAALTASLSLPATRWLARAQAMDDGGRATAGAIRRIGWLALVPLVCATIEVWRSPHMMADGYPILPLCSGLVGWGMAFGALGPLLTRALIWRFGALTAVATALAMQALALVDPRISIFSRSAAGELGYGIVAFYGAMALSRGMAAAHAAVDRGASDRLARQARTAREWAALDEIIVLEESLAAVSTALESAPLIDLTRVAERDVGEARQGLIDLRRELPELLAEDGVMPRHQPRRPSEG